MNKEGVWEDIWNDIYLYNDNDNISQIVKINPSRIIAQKYMYAYIMAYTVILGHCWKRQKQKRG